MHFKIGVLVFSAVTLLVQSALTAQAQTRQEDFRYGAPVVHTFDENYFPWLVHNTSVIGKAGTKGYDEWQSWGFIEEYKPVLNVGVWHKGADNTYKYSLRAVVLNLAPAIKNEFIDPEEEASFFQTDLGKLETLGFKYTLPQSRKNCLGFQMSPDDHPELYLRGYFCGERQSEPSTEVLMCIMESFVANSANRERPEPKPKCAGKNVYSKL